MIMQENATIDNDKQTFETIPQPPTKLLVGNLLELVGRDSDAGYHEVGTGIWTDYAA